MANDFTTTVDVNANLNPLTRQLNTVFGKKYNLNIGGIAGSHLPLGKISSDLTQFQKSLDSANARVLSFGASAGAVFAVTNAFKQLLGTTIEVDKALIGLNAIFNVNDKTLQKVSNSIFSVAKNTGQTFDQVSAGFVELARQGLGVEESLDRIQKAAVLARLGGISLEDSVNGLTVTLNAFSDAGLDAGEVINKIANLDLNFAVSTKDLIDGLQRVASVSKDAGLSLDNILALLTTAKQITGRSGSVIGNSFKTILTRLQRSSVADALKEVGVSDVNENGTLKTQIQLLTDLAKVYDNLTPRVKANIAEQVGGVFQINVLKATLGDLGKEYGLYQSALEKSTNASNEAIQKNEALNKSFSAQFNALGQSIKQFAAKSGDGLFGKLFGNVIGSGNAIFDGLNDLLKDAPEKNGEKAGQTFAQGFVKGIGNFIGGPALLSVTAIITKVFFRLAKDSGDAFLTLLNPAITQTNTQLLAQKQILEQIRNVQKSIGVVGVSSGGGAFTGTGARGSFEQIEAAQFRKLELEQQRSQIAAQIKGQIGSNKQQEGFRQSSIVALEARRKELINSAINKYNDTTHKAFLKLSAANEATQQDRLSRGVTLFTPDYEKRRQELLGRTQKAYNAVISGQFGAKVNNQIANLDKQIQQIGNTSILSGKSTADLKKQFQNLNTELAKTNAQIKVLSTGIRSQSPTKGGFNLGAFLGSGKFAGGAALGGLALNVAGGIAGEGIGGTLLNTGGNVLGLAGTGAALGGPVGAVVGGLTGLAISAKDLISAFDGLEVAAKKASDKASQYATDVASPAQDLTQQLLQNKSLIEQLNQSGNPADADALSKAQIKQTELLDQLNMVAQKSGVSFDATSISVENFGKFLDDISTQVTKNNLQQSLATLNTRTFQDFASGAGQFTSKEGSQLGTEIFNSIRGALIQNPELLSKIAGSNIKDFDFSNLAGAGVSKEFVNQLRNLSDSVGKSALKSQIIQLANNLEYTNSVIEQNNQKIEENSRAEAEQRKKSAELLKVFNESVVKIVTGISASQKIAFGNASRINSNNAFGRDLGIDSANFFADQNLEGRGLILAQNQIGKQEIQNSLASSLADINLSTNSQVQNSFQSAVTDLITKAAEKANQEGAPIEFYNSLVGDLKGLGITGGNLIGGSNRGNLFQNSSKVFDSLKYYLEKLNGTGSSATEVQTLLNSVQSTIDDGDQKILDAQNESNQKLTSIDQSTKQQLQALLRQQQQNQLGGIGAFAGNERGQQLQDISQAISQNKLAQDALAKQPFNKQLQILAGQSQARVTQLSNGIAGKFLNPNGPNANTISQGNNLDIRQQFNDFVKNYIGGRLYKNYFNSQDAATSLLDKGYDIKKIVGGNLPGGNVQGLSDFVNNFRSQGSTADVAKTQTGELSLKDYNDTVKNQIDSTLILTKSIDTLNANIVNLGQVGGNSTSPTVNVPIDATISTIVSDQQIDNLRQKIKQDVEDILSKSGIKVSRTPPKRQTN